ncbi:hypothetical protein N7451_006181 [Penicillium sp. IBT 35674x]|nr:hypothetical protein N7451_006181 [Penicillium sp. IBT 35674x]
MAPIKYNNADHPLFNLQRVPRVLEDIEETRPMMAMMRGLYLKPQDQARLDYRFYPWLRGWINPKKARCCRCFVLKRNFGNGSTSKKSYELIQQVSRLYKGLPQEDSAVIRTGGKPNARVIALKKANVKPTRSQLSTMAVTKSSHTSVLVSAEHEPGQYGRGASRIPNCLYHPGEPQDDVFTCCDQSAFTRGCALRWDHLRDVQMGMHNYDPSHPGNGPEWHFHETPDRSPIPPNTRSGVVVALKTGINRWGEQELIRLSVVDLYSGQVLIDNLVWPNNPMLHLDSSNSCITWEMMHKDHARGLCLEGREGALQRLWDFVTPNTYVVLHEGQKELIHLRWAHRKVIDTHELEGRMPASKEKNRTLKRLAFVHLKRNIQQGRFGLDSLEDAMACRDLVFWYGKHLPPHKRQDDHEPLVRLGSNRPGEWERELMEHECRIFLRIRAYHN